MPIYIWNGSEYVRVDDGAGNIQIKNVVYDVNKDGIIDADKIADLSRSKITDFFASPFWDNIPDKPTVVTSDQPKKIFVSSTEPTAENVGDIWIQTE